MKIKALTIYTSELDKQHDFYERTFELEPFDRNDHAFKIQVGHTTLTFEHSEEPFTYHYCFLIPNNKLHEAVNWLKERVNVITYENERVIEPGPEDWNSESIYFLDPTGNILEFIVRHDLENDIDETGFDASQIISVNEIGMASKHPKKLNDQLSAALGTTLKYGNLERFGAHGSQHGLFLLVNYKKKSTWFPTDSFPEPAPFRGKFEHNNRVVELIYRKESVQPLDI